MFPSFSGHGSSTITPPTTPSTAPRSNQSDVCQRSLHSPLTSPAQTTLSQSLLPLSNTSSITPRDSHKTNTMPIHVSADGVWENSTAYTLTNDAPLGVGAWSSVQLAIPSQDHRSMSTQAASDTPPATPVARSAQGFSKLIAPPSRQSPVGGQPQRGFASLNSIKTGSTVWAIKAPTNKTAQTVIRSEAHILSRISCWRPQPDVLHFVPFHGLDPQTGSLIMDALPLTLNDFINEDLDSLQEPSRSTLLASVFPSLAHHLLSGLDWLHHEAGVVHADIKPSNILLRPTRPNIAASMLQQRLKSTTSLAVGATLVAPSLVRSTAEALTLDSSTPSSLEDALKHVSFTPLFTDFSSALSLRPTAPVIEPNVSNDTTPPTSPTSAAGPVETSTAIVSSPPTLPTPSPFAAGTWDFLAPELCRVLPTPVPSTQSDVYALGITFLVLLTGRSPFDAVAQGNAIRRREMIKAGDAVTFAGMDQAGARRLLSVGRALSADCGENKLTAWLRGGLTKSVGARVPASTWWAWWVGEFGEEEG